MGSPQIITSPSGEELVVLPRQDYEDLVDALAAGRTDADLAGGHEELLSSEDVTALLASPVPLAFWRTKRGKTQAQLALEVGTSEVFLSELERSTATGDVTLYAKLARSINVQIEDLLSDQAME